MKLLRRLIALTVVCFSLGCTTTRLTMPVIDLPTPPKKPQIKSSVIVQNSIPWVAFSLDDSLKLYEYLLQKDSYEEKLRYRIDAMNNLWVGK